jgi:arylsulfatase A-like enzyme
VDKWFNAIDPAKVDVPEFLAYDAMHPCDFQATMLKGCVPNASVPGEVASFFSHARRQRIRRIYYAMIAEFDAMVGAYIDAVEESGLADNTIFVVTADHGDMTLNAHQQFYKMSDKDDSALVPLVIYQPGVRTKPSSFATPTTSLDLFPTFMDYAGVPSSAWPAGIAGTSMRPYVEGSSAPPQEKPVVVQIFSTADNAMPWTMIRQQDLKMTVYGTNEQMFGTLFNLTSDPDELSNLWHANPDTVAKLDATLRGVVDYPSVVKQVMEYNQYQLNYWSTQHGGPSNNATWTDRLANLDSIGGGWSQSWSAYPAQSLDVVKSIMSTRPPALLACQGPNASTDWAG